MFTPEAIEKFWIESGYDFNKCLGACMQAFIGNDETQPSGYEIKQLRTQVIEFVKNKTPYTYYGVELIDPDYNTLKDLVSGMTDTRKSESVDATPILQVDYATMRDFAKPHIKKLKRMTFGTGPKKSRMVIDCFGVPVTFGIKHSLLFRNDICKCDICGIAIDHVTIDYSEADNVHRITPWAYESSGRKVRMTVDHMQARGLGGKDQFSNTVPMCEPCNNKKSSIESRIANHNRDVRKLKNATIYPFQCSFYY